MNRAMPRALGPLVLVLCLAVGGCGPPTATVSGLVTFKGQPLTSGTVLFHGAEGRVEHALIGPDGRYTVTDAPIGPVRITVRSHAEMPKGMRGGGKSPAAPPELAGGAGEPRGGKFVAIPPRYSDPDKSNLSCTVVAGSQMQDIVLVP